MEGVQAALQQPIWGAIRAGLPRVAGAVSKGQQTSALSRAAFSFWGTESASASKRLQARACQPAACRSLTP